MVFPVCADNTRFLTAWELQSELRAGINIGNSLDAFQGAGIADYGVGQETYWGNPRITRELLQAFADKGFSTVRLPVTWSTHTTGDYVIDSAWLARVKEVVEIALDEGFYVILNSHHDSYDVNPNNTDRLEYEKVADEVSAIWAQVAPYFKDYPDTLVFETMNEPNNPNGWTWYNGKNPDPQLVDAVNRLNSDAYNIIRNSGGNNDKRNIIFATAGASIEGLNAITDVPDEHILFEVHLYPNAEVASGETTKIVHTADEIAEIQARIGAPVVIDECGFISDWDSSYAEDGDRSIVAAKVMFEALSKYGIPSALWDNGYGFGILDRKTYEYKNGTAEGVALAALNAYGVRNPNQPKLGDIDNDGYLTVMDIVLYKQSLANWTSAPKLSDIINIADIDGDGKTDILDVVLLTREVIQAHA
jgi:endoglucanase